jgi:hypothetical protein
LCKAVHLAVNGNQTPPGFTLYALRDIVKLEARPLRLTRIAYEWCSAIYANREKFEDWESLLLVCLELGFRPLDPWGRYTDVALTHTEYHRGLVDVVFKSQKSEAVADLLQALTTGFRLPEELGELVGNRIGDLVNLHNLVPFSPRLRQLVIRFIGIAGYRRFEGAGVERLVELLDYLHVTVEEADSGYGWLSLLLGVIRSSEGIQRLSHQYWELLVELAVAAPRWLRFEDIPGHEITESLIDAQEWGKLECWIGIEWVFPKLTGITEEDLEYLTLLLLRQRPGAARKLEEWMEQWSQRYKKGVPESFQRIVAS